MDTASVKANNLTGQRLGAFAVAFANTIVRSKPHDLEVQEYLEILRSKLRKPCDTNRWTSDKFSNDAKQLRKKDEELAALREEVELLKTALGASLQDSTTTPSTSMHFDLPTTQPELNETKRCANTLLRYVHAAHILMVNGVSTNTARLTSCLRSIVSTSLRLFAHVNSPLTQDDEMQESFTACSRAISVVYNGLSKLEQQDVNTDITHELVAVVVKLYRSVLDTLMRDNSQITLMQVSSARSCVRRASYPQLLAGLLLSLADQLKSGANSHCMLLEAYMSLLLGRAGEQVYRSAFDRPREQTLEEEIRVSEELPTQYTSLSLETAYLVELLKRTTYLASAFFNTSTSKTNSLENAQKAPLQARLQRTLVEAIFGPEENTIVSSSNIQPLSLPPAVPVDTSTHDLEELQGKEWVLAEVWAAVGWSILSR